MNDINPRYPAVIQSALRFLDGKGLARVQSAPLLHRLLWRMGIALPPPILAGFGTNALVQGLLAQGRLIHIRGCRATAVGFVEQVLEGQPVHSCLLTCWRTSHSPANSRPIRP